MIFCHFCLAFLLFHFSKSASMWPNPSSTVCFRVSALVSEGCVSSKKSKAVLRNQTPSARLAHAGLFLGSAASSSFSSPGAGAEALVSSRPSPPHSSAVLLALEFLQGSYLDPLQPPLFLPLPTVPFMIPSIGSVINCEVMNNTWTQSSPAGMCCPELDGFGGFC